MWINKAGINKPPNAYTRSSSSSETKKKLKMKIKVTGPMCAGCLRKSERMYLYRLKQNNPLKVNVKTTIGAREWRTEIQ